MDMTKESLSDLATKARFVTPLNSKKCQQRLLVLTKEELDDYTKGTKQQLQQAKQSLAREEMHTSELKAQGHISYRENSESSEEEKVELKEMSMKFEQTLIECENSLSCNHTSSLLQYYYHLCIYTLVSKLNQGWGRFQISLCPKPPSYHQPLSWYHERPSHLNQLTSKYIVNQL